jgi:hypothetical protein
MHSVRAALLLPVTVASVVLAAGCGPLATSAQAIGFQVLGYDPALRNAAASHILASTSLADLRALLLADQSVTIPMSPDSRYKGGAPTAWSSISIPDASLLVALVRQPTGGDCANADIESVRLADTTLTFNLSSRQRPCLPEDRAAAATPWLVAIPLKNLPKSVLALKIAHPPIADHANGLLYPTEYSSIVDLAVPLPEYPSDIVRTNEAVAAVLSAEVAIVQRLHRARLLNDWYLAGLGTRRWADHGLGCPPAGEQPAAGEVAGYVVQLVLRATSVSDVDQTFEYHVGGGRTLFCNGP